MSSSSSRRRPVSAMFFLGVLVLAVFCVKGGAAGSCWYPGHGLHSITNMTTPTVPAGTEVVYTCDKGFELIEAEPRRCKSDGTWTGKEAICAINVARHREVVRTSAYVDNADADISQRILDGYYSTCSVAHNADNVPSQWTIDLSAEQEIVHVQVVIGEPLKDIVFEVYYGDSPDSRTHVPQKKDKHPNMHPVFVDFELGVKETVAYDVRLKRPVNARYVIIRIAPYSMRDRISLCEVSVYSIKAATPDQCRHSWTDASATLAVSEATCYSFHREGSADRLSWNDARQRCSATNASLVSRVTDTSQSFLRSTLRSLYSTPTQSDVFWVGGHKRRDMEADDVTPIYRWINDTTQKYFSMSINKPGLADTMESCLSISGPLHWMWTTNQCHATLPWICQYSLPSCGSPDQRNLTSMRFSVTSSSGDSGKLVGSEIEYSCPDGHALIGTTTRHCLGNGLWSEHAPTCEYIDCGEPEEIENGTASLIQGGTTFGSAVEYSCSNPGEDLVAGSKTRVCERDGDWSGDLPFCGESLTIPESSQRYVAILSLEVLGIAFACLVLMVLLTAVTFLIVCATKRSRRRRRHTLPRFESDDLIVRDADDEKKKKTTPTKPPRPKSATKNGGVILAYSNGGGKHTHV